MYQELARTIIKNVGGGENISNFTHCATRLRFNLKNDSKADLQTLKSTKGVIGVVNSNGQLQIIIGSDVSNVYKEILNSNLVVSNDKQEDKKKGLSSIFEIIAGIFTPIMPPLTAAGMLKVVLIIASTFGWLSKESQTYYIFNFAADSIFFIFPVILGYTSAVKFKCNPYMGMLLGGAMIHPSYMALVNAKEAVTFLGLPMKLVTYASSVVPIILVVFVMSYVENFADKVSPKPIRFFLKPLITILVMIPLVFLVLGPLGSITGEGLAVLVNKINTVAPWLIPAIIGATTPLLVMIGMHWAIIPIGFNELALKGFENFIGPGMMVSNIAHGGAILAVALKTKNKDFKQLAGSSGFSALFGITEPAMYGVTLKLKKPLIPIMVAGGLAGLYCGLMGVVRYSTGMPGLASIAIFISDIKPSNVIHALIACGIAFVVGFIGMFVVGFEDIPNENKEKVKKEKKEAKPDLEIGEVMATVKSIADGEVIELSAVKDEAFASESLGKGFAIIPENGKILSPINGTVASIFATNHAIGLESQDGTEILIHIGIDTVRLNGEHFKSLVKEGDSIKIGDVLVEFEKDKVVKKGFDISTPVIITNTFDYKNIIPIKFGKVKAGEDILSLA